MDAMPAASLKDLAPPLDEDEVGLVQPIVTFETTVAFFDEEASLSGVYSGANAMKRYLSCVIVMHLPENGVDEAFDWLVDAWKFYAHPVIASTPVALTQAPVRATGGNLVVQPPLVIAED